MPRTQGSRKRVLVLNADYSAMAFTTWQSAIKADFKGLCRIVENYKDDFIKTAHDFEWPAPAVIALIEYKKAKKKKVPFSRPNVFLRDRLRCQYCGEKFHFNDLTFDHVIPRSKWNNKRDGPSPTLWTNIVTCCYDCNHKKGNDTLKQSGMKLKKDPVEPNSALFIPGLAPWSKLQPEWLPYIPTHYRELLGVNE